MLATSVVKRSWQHVWKVQRRCYNHPDNLSKGSLRVAHSLNLCVVAACNIQLVKNMMGTMVEIRLFFCHSPKHQLELENNIKSIPGATAKKLVSLRKTRCVARIDALEVFFTFTQQ